VGTANFSGRPEYYLDVDAAVQSQDYGSNTSVIYWRAIAVKNSTNTGYWSGASSANNWDGWSNVGDTGAGSGFAYDFRGGPYASQMIAQGTFTITHNSEGFAQYQVATAVNLNNGIGGATAYSAVYDAPRIPKIPSANGAPSFSNILPTTATVSWPANGDPRGAAIDQYLLRVHTNSNVEAAGYTDYPLSPSTFSYNLTGLTPGTNYYAAVYAHNGMGYAPKSATSTFKTLSGAYAWNGSEWRPCEVLEATSSGWRSLEVNARKSSSWVLAS